jgi:hypothetical protein
MPNVKMPDGQIVRFPDDMPSEQIRGMIAQKFPDAIGSEMSQKEFEAPAPPPGMVLDPNTGQMVDTAAIAERQNQGVMGTLGTIGATAMSGVPFVGEYFDEAVGDGDPVRTEVARQRMGQFAEANPKTALATKIAGGLSAAVPAAIAAAPGLATVAPSSLAGQVLVGGGVGAGGGALEGAVSGYGRGTDQQSRMEEAKRGAVIGGATGSVVGAATPLVVAGAKPAFRKVADALNLRRQTAQSGLSRPSRDILTRAMDADGSFTGQGAQNIRRAGPDAMLADSGPNARAILDTAIQRSGRAGNVAREAVEGRATTANRQLTQAFDDTLGQPQGVRSAARGIAQGSSGARGAAYDAAYSQPINYADDAGRRIEDVLSRIPPRIQKTAIDRANEAMTAGGRRNMQIFADIADDGTVAFRRPPNVEQLDMIKRELGNMGAEAVDQFGRPKAEGRMLTGLARDLRDALGDAAPDYRVAVQLGGDKIAEDNALALGQKLLSRATTRETVAEMAQGMTDAQRRQAATGLRSTLDEQLAQVQRTVMDGNLDAREAVKAIKDLSSRANREKVALIVGDDAAAQLFDQIDRAAMSLDLRAGVTQNSKTYARQSIDEIIKDASGSVLDTVGPALDLSKPGQAVRMVAKAVLGKSDTARLEITDRTYEELARVLTQARGGQAQQALQNLQVIAARSPQNERLARALAQRAGLALGAAGYQTGTRSLGN